MILRPGRLIRAIGRAVLEWIGVARNMSRGVVECTTDWFSHNESTLTRLFRDNNWLNTQLGLRALEIGTWEGQSACWLLQHVCRSPSSRLVCIDTFLGAAQWGEEYMKKFKLNLASHSGPAIEARFDRNVEALGANARVTKIKDTALHGLATLLAQKSDPFDVIYIDGSHEPKDVLTDAVMSWPLLRSNGILIFDDYRWGDHVEVKTGREPKQGIDAFKSVFQEEFEILDETYQCILKKRAMPAQQ